MAGRGVGGASGAFAPRAAGRGGRVAGSTKPRTIHRSPGRRGRPSASGVAADDVSVPAADEALEGLPGGDPRRSPRRGAADCGFSTNRLYGHRPHVAATLAGRLVGPLAAGPRLRPAGVRRKPRRRRPRRLTEGRIIGPSDGRFLPVPTAPPRRATSQNRIGHHPHRKSRATNLIGRRATYL